MRKSPATSEEIETLRSLLPPGSKVRCVLRRVSRSGMEREIALFAVLSPDDIRDVTYLASRVLGDRIGKRGGIVIGGCGMDMGFALVSQLSYQLYPDGFPCTGNRYTCGAPEHVNRPQNGEPDMRNDYTPGRLHERSGDYALRHEWL